MKKLGPGKLSSFNWKRKMDETNWSSDFYSDIFSLGLDSLFNTIDLESLESKENSDTVPEVLNNSYVNKYSKTEILAFCSWHN